MQKDFIVVFLSVFATLCRTDTRVDDVGRFCVCGLPLACVMHWHRVKISAISCAPNRLH